MVRRQLKIDHESVTCAVCGRSLLRGEEATQFVAAGSRRPVCELCTTRAAHEGWRREGAAPELEPRPRGGERARSLVGRLRARFEESAGSAPAPSGGTSARSGSRRVHAIPADAQIRTVRAVEVFNRSEHPRMVAGIARSLGAPAVEVTAQADALVTITIAWELCWYRFEADLGSDAVRLAAQGDELGEIGGSLSALNASAGEDGRLVLAVAEESA